MKSVNYIIIIIIFLFLLTLSNSNRIMSFLNLKRIKYTSFVINLDKDVKRMKKLDKKLKKESINYHRFPAIYGKNVSEKEKEKYIKTNKLNDGQIGCLLSHVKIWENIINNNKYMDNDNFIIFEDDIIPVKKFNKKLSQYMKQLNNIEWDLIYLGGNTIIGNKYSKNFIKPISYNGNWGFFGYMFTKKSIRKIYNLIIPTDNALDSKIKSYYHILNVFTIEPQLVIHDYNNISHTMNKNRKKEKEKRNKIRIY